MAAASHAQLKEFVTKVLCPRISVATNLCEKIKRQCFKLQTDEVRLFHQMDKKELDDRVAQLAKVLAQHTALFRQWCSINHELGEEMPEKERKRIESGKTDVKFNLWLAKQSICADTPDLASLREKYNAPSQ